MNDAIRAAGATMPDGSYVFPDKTGVRVTCFCVLKPKLGYSVSKHSRCKGRGWNVATNGWVWLTAATSVFPGFIGRWANRWSDYRNQTYKCHEPDDLEADFFEFLLKLLGAMDGVTLGGPVEAGEA